MVLSHRKKRPSPAAKDQDENQEAASSEKGEEASSDRYSKGDEYEILLRYVQDEADLAKKKSEGSEDGGDDEGHKMVRKWYSPWKKTKVEGSGEKKIPDDWLKTSLKGLDDSEVERRRKDLGFNELTSPHENQILKFIGYFRGPILYCMELAVVLSAGLQDWIDFGVIIAILFLNAGVGWYQEKQAGDIVAQLKQGIALKATALRNGGKETEVEARDLVVGDIIVLEEGKTIPADATILCNYGEGDSLDENGAVKNKSSSGGNAQRHTKDHASDDTQVHDRSDGNDEADDADEEDGDDKGPSIVSVDQSAITGESLAVDKFVGEVAYYTCGVKRGKAYGRVCVPARLSFVGKTAALVTGSNEKGHFQIILSGIGTSLLVMVIFFVLASWIGAFFHAVNISTPQQNNLLVYALIFLIIGVPVGLPCVSTTCLAVGAAYLAKQKCIVQKLSAIESLAGVDVLCTDKTGTLTANKLSLNDPYLTKGTDKDWFMTVAVLASSHNVKTLDPIDQVTIKTLKDYPGAQENLKSGWKTKKFSPFDPVSKRIVSEVEKDGKSYTCAKGAPNAILKLKRFDPATSKAYRDKAQEFATRGFRSLGVAIKEDGKDWELLGIMSMSDPPRGDTRATIGEAKELGIQVKMLTGDAVAIGKELARQLGLGTNIYDSEKLLLSASSGSEICDFVEAADGFAEVFPEHKYQVVELLQQRKHLVAMTGDGVNDAPSLKRADCGIAVEGASDAARTAAAVVFLDEGLKSIITSIKVAREIFHRLKAYIIYRIALCIHLEVYLMLSIVILNETIRVDLIVFLALFADVGTLAIAYDNAPFARSPVEWQLPKVWIMSTVMGLLLALGTWIIRGTMFHSNGGIIQNFGSIQEVLFLEVALTESWVIFITRLKQTKDENLVMPSWQLVIAVLGVDVLASIFCIFGWLSGPGDPDPAFRSGATSIVTVVKIWIYSFGVVVVVALFYLLLNNLTWLDNLGKSNRGHKNEKLENFLTELQRMTIKHETDATGADFYLLGTSTPHTTETDDHEASNVKKNVKEDKEGNESAAKETGHKKTHGSGKDVDPEEKGDSADTSDKPK